jgi:hypothetical protein
MNGKQREERKEEKKFAGGTKTFMSEFKLSTLSSGVPRFITYGLAIVLLLIKYIIQLDSLLTFYYAFQNPMSTTTMCPWHHPLENCPGPEKKTAPFSNAAF